MRLLVGAVGACFSPGSIAEKKTFHNRRLISPMETQGSTLFCEALGASPRSVSFRGRGRTFRPESGISDRYRACLQKDGQILCAHRAGEGVTLQDIASHRPEQVDLRLRLDTFRDDFYIERVTHLDNGGDQAAMTFAARQRSNQRAIYLQPLGVQGGQAENGGVSCAEVVDLDGDTGFSDPIDGPGHLAVKGVEKNRFEHFENESTLRKVLRGEGSQQLGIKQAAGGDVHRHTGYLKSFASPS